MKILTLKRIALRSYGVFGVLFEEENPFCITVERPWLDNKPNKSCIPIGEYICRQIESKKFGHTYEVIDVPNRTNILFHKGNFPKDSQGCIILAEKFGILDGKRAGLSSGEAFSEFLEVTRNAKEFKLVIVEMIPKPYLVPLKKRRKL